MKMYETNESVTLMAYGSISNVKIILSSYVQNKLPALTGTCDDGSYYGSLTINLNATFGESKTTVLNEYYEQLVVLDIVKPAIEEITYGFGCKAYVCEINLNKFHPIME